MLSSKFCFYSGCVNDPSVFSFENDGDCISYQAANIIRETTAFLLHYKAMKKKFMELTKELKECTRELKDCTKERDRLSQKYKEEKAKVVEITLNSSSRKSKTSPTLSDSSKRNKSKILKMNAILKNDSSDEIDPMFRTSTKPRKIGKENSPDKVEKKAISTKTSVQPKLNSFVIFTKTKKPNETNVKPSEPFDDDMTYCEELEKAKIAPTTTNQQDTCKTLKRKMPPRRNSYELFKFREPSSRSMRPQSPSQELKDEDETPDFSQLKKIKQEPQSPEQRKKITENPATDFSVDLIQSDDDLSIGDSLFIVEPDEKDNEPISIQNSSFETDRKSIEQLKNPPISNPFFETSKSPVLFAEPTRKRLNFYGDCFDCRMFYDKIDEVNGPTQADEYIRNCQTKCKGYWVRRNRVEPAAPLAQYKYRNPDDTPEGYWDLRFSQDNETPDNL